MAPRVIRFLGLIGFLTLASACSAFGVTVGTNNNDDGSLDGLWLLETARINGEDVSIDQALFLEMGDDRGHRQRAEATR